MNARKILGFAVAGAKRGSVFRKASDFLPDQVNLCAVCDQSEEVLRDWLSESPEVRGYRNFSDLLADEAVDAIFISTPPDQHASQSVEALQAGKHVLCEVPAATTLQECYDLIEAVEDSGKVYMLAENYCYFPEVRTVEQLCRSDRFGQIILAESAYIHDCRELFVEGEKLTWRGETNRRSSGNSYPTHSLGPISKWLDLCQAGGDRLKTVAAFVTRDDCLSQFFGKRFGENHPYAKRGFFSRGDSVLTVLTTREDVLITLRLDTRSPRPANKAYYALQGTKGCLVSGRHDKEEGLVWFDEESDPDFRDQWKTLSELPEYSTVLEKQSSLNMPEKRSAEYLMLHDFVNSIRLGNHPAIDVYEAVSWSCLIPLSQESLEKSSVPVQIPDFCQSRNQSGKANA